jgi:hypothetical protein
MIHGSQRSRFAFRLEYKKLFKRDRFLSGSAIVLPHLITLSALTSTFGGIVRPICFAVFRLITSSNFVGCSTGKSAGQLWQGVEPKNRRQNLKPWDEHELQRQDQS